MQWAGTREWEWEGSLQIYLKFWGKWSPGRSKMSLFSGAGAKFVGKTWEKTNPLCFHFGFVVLRYFPLVCLQLCVKNMLLMVLYVMACLAACRLAKWTERSASCKNSSTQASTISMWVCVCTFASVFNTPHSHASAYLWLRPGQRK